jgi:LysR family transcriptional activator of mexEF-oprN operon
VFGGERPLFPLFLKISEVASIAEKQRVRTCEIYSMHAGIVENSLHKARRSRCSVAGFANIAAIVEGSELLATVPRTVATAALSLRRHLRIAELPFTLSGAATELLWPGSTDDDDACKFLRQRVVEVASELGS